MQRLWIVFWPRSVLRRRLPRKRQRGKKRPAAPAPVAAEEEEETPELLARREALWSQIRRDSEARARGEPVR